MVNLTKGEEPEIFDRDFSLACTYKQPKICYTLVGCLTTHFRDFHSKENENKQQHFIEPFCRQA